MCCDDWVADETINTRCEKLEDRFCHALMWYVTEYNCDGTSMRSRNLYMQLKFVNQSRTFFGKLKRPASHPSCVLNHQMINTDKKNTLNSVIIVCIAINFSRFFRRESNNNLSKVCNKNIWNTFLFKAMHFENWQNSLNKSCRNYSKDFKMINLKMLLIWLS